VIASYEAVVQDLAALQALPWDTVTVDLRYRSGSGSLSSISSAITAVSDLACRQRLVMLSTGLEALSSKPGDIQTLTSYVRPQESEGLPSSSSTDTFTALLQPAMCR
jgi:hypothetical protein